MSHDVRFGIIASPNHTHRSALDDCWGTGVHLFIEKPLCTTVPDALAVQQGAARHDGLVWMGLEYRYLPAIGDLLGEVRSGTAGTVRMVTVREHRYPFLVRVDDWNRFSVNTGGTQVEKCCHFFDLMNRVTGTRPVRVLASGGQDVNHLDEVYDGVWSVAMGVAAHRSIDEGRAVELAEFDLAA